VTAEDWATVASLATAVGTLVLAVATFSAVRSGNRSARVAEQSLMLGLRPVLMASHREDTPLKVNFGDDKWVRIPGACAVAEIGGGDGSLGPAAKDDVIYLAMSMRNVGNGMAVLHGWHFYEERPNIEEHAALDAFRPHTRDLYLPVNEPGFWQGAFRDTADRQYAAARRVVEDRQDWFLEILYGDQDGGQRVITRFRLQPFGAGTPGDDTKVWMASVNRHWNLDRPDPR
jgi:hypothetical protein